MHKVTLTGQPGGSILAVMVVWNGINYLADAVESVLKELGPDNSLLIVDNASTDGSYEYILENYKQVAVLQTHENLGGAGGFSAGMHAALEFEECEYIWLLDNDIVAEHNALEPLIALLESKPRAAAAGSQLCLYRQPNTIQAIGGMYTAWLGDVRGNHYNEFRITDDSPLEVDYLAACSVLVRRSALQEVGVFSDLFIFFDDVDWCLRAAKKGYSLWAVPASVVRHDFGGAKATVPWREYYRKRNKLYCLDAHPPTQSGRAALLLYLCYINYLNFYHRLAGDRLYARVYKLALDDFLQLKMGKKNLSEFPFVQPFQNGDRPIRRCTSRLIGLMAGSLKGIFDAVRYLLFRQRQDAGHLEFFLVHAKE